MKVAELWRYPVKSMQGERLAEADLTQRGVVGDRAYGIVDATDGKVASAKNPWKWGRLLEAAASFVEPPTVDGPAPAVRIELPDGSAVTSNDADVDERLSAYIGREVHLASEAPSVRKFEEVWPEISGLAPDDVIASTRVGEDEDGLSVSEFDLGLVSPAGTFFDLAVLHVLTTASLAALKAANADGDFDVRRYRPNVLLDTGGDGDAGFVENEWRGATLRIGEDVAASVMLPAMRCVMTTMAQPGLPRDLSLLKTIAANNRVEIPGMGVWACLGAYASVAAAGRVSTGDRVSLHRDG